MASKLTALMRMSGFALSKASKTGAQKVSSLLEIVAEDLLAAGVPAAAVDRIRALGKSVLKGGVPKSVTALAGSAENSKTIQETLAIARDAVKGVSNKDLTNNWNTLLQGLEKEGVSPRVIEGLKSLDPVEVAKVGAGQTLSAFDRLGPDPFITQMYRRVLGKGTTTKGQSKILTEVLGEAKEKVNPETTKMLTAGGIPGFSGMAQAGRAVAGATTGYSPVGAAVNVGLPAFFGAKGLMQNDPSVARTQAVEGFMALGGTSSSAVLSEIVKQQEMAARRQMTLQTHDPELFSRVLGVLSDTGAAPSMLTKTERAIGQPNQQPMPSRRTDEDTKFLLDQLLNEASGSL